MVYPALLPLMPHTSAASSPLNWHSPADLNVLVRSARKTKSGFCACAITFHDAVYQGHLKGKGTQCVGTKILLPSGAECLYILETSTFRSTKCPATPLVVFTDIFTKLRKATVIFVNSVCLSTWNISALIGRIFMRLNIWVILLFCSMSNKCTQLFHKLSHSYMFRHYCIILRGIVINTLPSYISISSTSNAAVGNKIYNQDVSHRLYANSHIIVIEISILWNL